MKLSVENIRKNYSDKIAVDEISSLLRNLSYINHTVEIGGEMKTSGYKNKDNWNIGI